MSAICFFKQKLMKAGVDEKTAEEEACRIEHDISDDTFNKIKLMFDET